MAESSGVRSRRGSGAVAAIAPSELVEAPPLRDQIYSRLRDSILTGELPAGARVSPASLAKSFRVSTMPVREALRLLEDDGLVETSPRRWTRVASPDPAVADEVYPMLAVLEDFALRTAPRPPVAAITAARAANAALARAASEHDVLACVAADAEFHAILMELSPNHTLRRTLVDLKARIRLLEGSFFRVSNASRSVSQHEEVLEALIRGEMTEAGAIVADNWVQGLMRLRESFAQAGE
jgi:DNA-binding GntR family transcriptional regulator